MLIIPIGQEGAIRRVPVVTIGLIAICVLIHFYTDSALERQLARYQDAFEHRNELVFTYAAELQADEYGDDYVDLPDGGLTYADSVHALQTFMETQIVRVDEAMESGELYPVGSPEYEEWLAAKEELKAAEEDVVFIRFGFTPAKPSVFTLLSSMFFHGGILHLVFNMIFLWAAGVMMESSWGHLVYGVGYLVSGVAATLIHWVSAIGSEVPCVGASGAIAGMMGAYMVVHFHERVHIFWCYFFGFVARAGTAKCPAWLLLGMWIIGQITWAILTANVGEGGGVAYWAHIGGFVFGVVLAFAIRHTGYEVRLHVDGPPPTEEEIRASRNEVVESARELCNDGKKGEARAILEHLIEQDASVASAQHLLGTLHAEKSEFTKAKVRLENAIKGYCRENCADLALEAFEELKPNCAEGDIEPAFIFDLACAVERGGYPEKAAQLFVEVATEHASDSFASKAGIRAGMLYEQIERIGAAKQIYRYVEKNASDPFFKEEADNRLRALEHETALA